MSLSISLDKKNIDKLIIYLKEYENQGEKDMSGIWEKFSKNSKIKIINNRIHLKDSLFTSKGRLALDPDFLTMHGFKKPNRLINKLNQAKERIKILLKYFIFDDLRFQLRFYANIWDNIDNVLTSKDLIKDNKFLTWDIIKSYNFYNEIFPIINKMKNPKYYLEIGPGGCHLPSVIKNYYGKKLKFIFIDLKSSIPFGFINISKKFPDSKIFLPNEITSKEQVESLDYDFLFLNNEQLHFIPDSLIDIAVNTNSFMEMLPQTILKYFNLLRRVVKDDNLFFCHNRVEKKMWKPGVDIKKSKSLLFNNPNIKKEHINIRFSEYPWRRKDNDYFYYVPRFTEIKFKHSFFTRATKLSKT